MWDITNYLFGDDKPPTIQIADIDEFHQRLKKAMENLPECVRLGNTPNIGAMDLQ